MKVTIEINDGLAGYQFKDDNGEVVRFEDLSRLEQIRILNGFANGYEFSLKYLKRSNYARNKV